MVRDDLSRAIWSAIGLASLLVALACSSPPSTDVSPVASSARPPRPAVPAGGAAVGVLVPPLSFLDQDGHARTLRDFSGRVAVLTFIFTRCPMPDQCPLMVRHLEYIRRRADREGLAGRVALIGVTLDPSFDTPPVLRAYGETVLAGKNRFERWTLGTGTGAEIAAIAGYFGLGYSAESGLVTHTLQTVVIGSDGRVLGLFPSNSWRPEEVYDVVRLGADRAGAGS